MTADLKKLTDSLRRDTPEKTLERSIRNRQLELVCDLENGRTFEIRDVRGKVVRISRAKESSRNTY